MEEKFLSPSEEHRFRMVFDAMMRIMDNEALPKTLYILGYNFAKVEHLLSDPLLRKEITSILDGPPDLFMKAVHQYIDNLPPL